MKTASWSCAKRDMTALSPAAVHLGGNRLDTEVDSVVATRASRNSRRLSASTSSTVPLRSRSVPSLISARNACH